MTDEPPGPPTEHEREEWRALVAEPRLDMLPEEALIASIRHLAGRLLELAAVIDAYQAPPGKRWPEGPMSPAERIEHERWMAKWGRA